MKQFRNIFAAFVALVMLLSNVYPMLVYAEEFDTMPTVMVEETNATETIVSEPTEQTEPPDTTEATEAIETTAPINAEESVDPDTSTEPTQSDITEEEMAVSEDTEISEELEDTETIPDELANVQNISIDSGEVYDLSTTEYAANILELSSATIYIEYASNSSQEYQSLFSVSNPSTETDAMYRHFHLYITPSGTLGMELRNTDTEFKYTMSATSAVTATETNKVAIVADETAKTYKLFANGEKVAELSKDDYKFFNNITGLSKISLGGTIRNGEVGYPFGGSISTAVVYSSAKTDAEMIAMTTIVPTPVVGPLIEKTNIEIESGSVYDLSNEAHANDVYALHEGTIYVEFESTSEEAYQSLFSVSNPSTATGDMYRHFHLYITPTGNLGMELRNTDSVFKYTMLANAVLDPDGTNRVAFKADATAKKYSLFANGEKVGELTKDEFKFFDDITGLTKISLGGTVRNGEVDYPFTGHISNAIVYGDIKPDADLIAMTTLPSIPDVDELLIDKSNMTIAAGSHISLNDEENAAKVEAMDEGTIIVSFTTTSNEGVQSLFSVGNSTSGNQNRHFHLYITNTGTVGMELRNNDDVFKYTLGRPAALDAINHGQVVENTIAFKADKDSKTFSLFANGTLIDTTTIDQWKFISDITGVDNITVGATMRNGAAAYQYSGAISGLQVYNYPLPDNELALATSETTYGTKIFYAGDGTGSNYYRIPTLLKLKNGTVVSSIDCRYGGTHDARSNIDIAFSRSTDGGVSWSAPTLPLVFDDYAPQTIDWLRDNTGKNVQISGSASFIDSVLLQDQVTGRLFLFADAFSSGKGFNNVGGGTGFKEIDGTKYVKLHWHEDGSNTYNYTIRENGAIYNDTTGETTGYSVDGNYRIKYNGAYLTQKQYRIRWSGTTLIEEKTDVDVNQCIFYKDSVFNVMPTNYLVMKYSDDNGITWSDMKILGDFRDVNGRMVLFGPGVGTQIKNGPHAGRLLISSYNSVSGEYGYMYSDDHGDTWKFVQTDLGAAGSFAEAQIVEFPDGTLRTYMRTNVGKVGYITSYDGGMTWNAMAYVEGVSVASYGTQLSAINTSHTINGKPVILLSTPTATNGRRGGEILVGLVTDTGATGYDKYTVDWAYRYEVDSPQYGFSYSCMTELPDGRIGILYEKYDSWSRNELHLKDIMRYEIYTMDELTQE